MNPSEDLYTCYSKCFDYFNKELFKNELPRCVLNFSRKSGRNYGYFSTENWEDPKTGEKIDEISINPNNMKNRGDTPEEALKNICSTIVHEMCHSWQYKFGKPGKGNYHNKEWAAKMISIGLIPSKTGEPEGKMTGSPMSHYIESGGIFEQCFKKMPEDLRLPLLGVNCLYTTSKFSGTVVYKCRKCEYSLRGKPGIKVECLDCFTKLECEV